ncbi:hypothetical protein Pcinc_027339 [Petrolisthes cinctipes]|uniref:Uncharacterized protein n=1 Tax=Petrolisthes cinctipes TaxID=88211 RepID=A0AAE1KAZ8_PETCI|nr:hypothetical protein Pcinc_027339 [Petrolisthes cinctipes]
MQELLSRLLLVFAVLCPTFSTARPRTWSGVGGGEEPIFAKQVDPSHTVTPPPPTPGTKRSTILRRETFQGFNSFPAMTREHPATTNKPDKMILRARSKRSVGTLEYRGQINQSFRVQGDEAFYLAPVPSSQTLALTTLNPTSTNRACFRIHVFDVIGSSNPNINRVIILETNNGSHHLHGNTTGDISLTATSMSWLNNLTSIDHRFFRLYNPIGNNHYRIKHVLTERYLQARTDGVSLVQGDPRAAPGMHYQMDPCTQAAAT